MLTKTTLELALTNIMMNFYLLPELKGSTLNFSVCSSALLLPTLAMLMLFLQCGSEYAIPTRFKCIKNFKANESF